MAQPILTRGATSVIIPVTALNTASVIGGGKSGLVFNTSGLTCYYERELGNVSVVVSLATMTLGTWATGGFKEVDATNMPGEYAFGIPNAAISASDASKWVKVFFQGAAGAVFPTIVIPLTALDLQLATEPVNVTQWNGTNVATPATAGIPDVNMKNANNVAATNITTINSNFGTTQPVNFTGTGASALVKSDMVDIAGAAASTSSAQIGANVVSYASGQAPLQPTVSGRTLDVSTGGEAGLDWANIGSPTTAVDLSGTTIKNVDNAIANVTLVATTTNLTNAPTAGDFTATMKTSLNAATPSVTVSDKTGFSLSAAGIQAIWDRLTSALTTVGSIGKLLVDNIDATISSRTKPADTQARVTLVDTTTVATTATNLTNAPTNGDFTAVMKASLNASTPTSVTTVTGNVNGSVGSVVGNVGGSVASVTAPVTVGTNNDKTGYTLSSPGIQGVVDGVWNEPNASHLNAGSTGFNLNAAGSGGSVPTVQQIVDGVWDEPNADHVDTGSTGYNQSLIPAILAAQQASGTITLVDGFDTSANLHVKRFQTYGTSSNVYIRLTIVVPVDPTLSGTLVYWTFKIGSNTTLYPGVVDSYDAGTGAAVFQLPLTYTETGALPAQNANAVNNFALSLVLPGSDGNLQPIPYQTGRLYIEDAPSMPPA